MYQSIRVLSCICSFFFVSLYHANALCAKQQKLNQDLKNRSFPIENMYKLSLVVATSIPPTIRNPSSECPLPKIDISMISNDK